MKINLNHDEINEAIVNWVAKQGIDLTDKETVVELTAGRGINGNSASIDIKPIQFKSVGHLQIEPEECYVSIVESNEPKVIGDVTEVEPFIPDDTPVVYKDF